MKAIRVHNFGNPEVLGIKIVADPVPASGQIAVRVCAAGVNPVDTYIRAGNYASLPELPYTPGVDGAGIIEQIGADISSSFQRGQRVWINGSLTGTYAEMVLCHDEQVYRLPEKLSFAQGAAIGTPYITAYRALVQVGKVKPGCTVLVHGATGGVGLAALQWARHYGASVYATGGSEEGRKLLSEQGAEKVFDHHASDYIEHIIQATNGRGVEVVVEMLANVNLEKDLRVIGKGGRIVIVGNRGRIEISPRDAMSKDAAIHGVMTGNMRPDERKEAIAAIQAGLEQGIISPIVAEEIPLSLAATAHEKVISSSHRGKIVLIPES